MTPALIWLVVAIGLMAAEALSGDLVLLMLGGGALFGAGAAALSGNMIVAVIVFAVAATALLVLARPALKRRFVHPPQMAMGPAALVGTHGTVVSTVDGHDGRVKLGGDIWSARSYVDGEQLEPGTRVTVVEISGATAVVTPAP